LNISKTENNLALLDNLNPENNSAKYFQAPFFMILDPLSHKIIQNRKINTHKDKIMKLVTKEIILETNE